MQEIRRRLRRMFNNTHPLMIFGVITTIVICLLALSGLSMQILSATRAYIAAEGLWSKGQKDAIYYLVRYGRSQNEADFESYSRAVAVTLAIQRARLELDKQNPDMGVVRQGILDAGNHPEDVDDLIMLYRRFRHLSYVNDSIAVWARGDDLIAQLNNIASSLREEVHRDAGSASRIQELLEKIHAINLRFIPLTAQFSILHGEASRFVSRLLYWSALLGGTILLLFGALLIRRIQRHDYQVRKQRSLREGDKQLSAVLRHAPYPLVIARINDGVLVYTNLQARKYARLPVLLPENDRAADFFVDPKSWDCLLQQMENNGLVHDRELEMQNHQQKRFWALISIQPVHFDGEACALLVFSNIDKRRQTEQLLQFKASHDPLTGLPNRGMFDEQFTQTLAHAQRHQRGVGLFFIDLDGFKQVNDSFGHDAGDVLLKELATRLRSSLRKGDIVGRFGGDEFVVLITEFNNPGQLAAVARQVIDTIAQPLVEGAHKYRVTASVGISMFPQDGEDTKTLLQNADSAMYRAKEQGKNRFNFYEPI